MIDLNTDFLVKLVVSVVVFASGFVVGLVITKEKHEQQQPPR